MDFRTSFIYAVRLGFVNLLVYTALIVIPANQGLSQESVRYSVKNWLEALQSQNLFTQMNVAYREIDFDADPENSTSLLISAMKHPDANVRRYVANALGELPIKPERVVPVLIEALRDKDEQVREHAVVALAKVGSPAVPALVEALQQVSMIIDPSKRISENIQTDVRLSDLASVALWKSDAPIVVELFNIYRKNLELPGEPPNSLNREFTGSSYFTSSGYLRRNILLIIRKRGASLVPELIPFLKDKNTAVRLLALDSLAVIGPKAKTAISEISVIVKGTDKSLSKQAVETLDRLGGSAIPVLTDMLLTHPDPEIRSDAANALFQIRLDDMSAVIALSKALKDGDVSVQENVASALNLTIEQSNPILPQIISPGLIEKEKICPSCQQNLSRVAKIILPNLIEALQIPNRKVQSDVATVLANIGKDAKLAIPIIIRGLSKSPKSPPNFPIGEDSYYSYDNHQNSFIYALGEIADGDSNTVSVLSEILKDPSRQSLHNSAIVALGKLGAISEPAVPLIVKKYRNDFEDYQRRDTANFDGVYGEKDQSIANAKDQWIIFDGIYGGKDQSIANALAMIQPVGTFALLEILQNPNENQELRLSACNALQPIIQQDKQIIQSFRQLTQDLQPSIRLCVAQYLASMDDSIEVVLPILEEAFLKGKMWEVSQSFEKLGSKSVPTILNLLEKHPSEVLINTLGKIYLSNPQDSRIIPVLIRLLEDPNLSIRQNAANVLGELSPVNNPDLVRALVALLEKEIKPGVEFSTYSPASTAFSTLQKLGSSAKEAMPAMIKWVSYPDVFVRRNAIQVLGRIGTEAKSTKDQLILALTDDDQSVRALVAQALLDIGFELDELKPIFTAIVDDYINRQLEDAYYDIANTVKLSIHHPMAFSPPIHFLPPFPWPNPPRPAHIAVAGNIFPRNLLGTDSTTLQTVYQRLFNALVKTDPGFESGLFGVSGGFAMISKIERIQKDGTPFPEQYRWVEGKVPPLDLKDYIGRLFFENPGYFRVIVFVITPTHYTPENPSTKPVPKISEGAQDLPDEIARELFKGKNGYVLIYSFEKKQGGEIQEFKINSLSGLVHLEKSGILNNLR